MSKFSLVVCLASMNRSVGVFLNEVLSVDLGLLFGINVINKPVPGWEFLNDQLSSRYFRNILFAALERSGSKYKRCLELLFLTINLHRACNKVWPLLCS